MNFDILIAGGGAAGMSCALVLGSARDRIYAKDKKIGILLHQRTSHLQSAVLNNALGIPPGTPGAQILEEGAVHLAQLYPHVHQIYKEKVREITETESGFIVFTNKATYQSDIVIIAAG